MSEPFVGQITTFGFNFAPRGWAFCNGQLLAISQNDALFSLLGTIYGGDGRTTFALPDLRGRSAIHFGNGPGLSGHAIGDKRGAETVTLNVAQLPAHNHPATLKAINAPGNETDPTGNMLAEVNDAIYEANASGSDMGSDSIVVGNTGGNHSVNNMQPYLALNWCIALFGVYPSRN